MINIYNKGAYCKGFLCRKSDRRHKSVVSGKMMCGVCAFKTRKGYMTFDEYWDSPTDWDAINKEFDEMILRTKKQNKVKMITSQVET